MEVDLEDIDQIARNALASHQRRAVGTAAA